MCFQFKCPDCLREGEWEEKARIMVGSSSLMLTLLPDYFQNQIKENWKDRRSKRRERGGGGRQREREKDSGIKISSPRFHFLLYEQFLYSMSSITHFLSLSWWMSHPLTLDNQLDCNLYQIFQWIWIRNRVFNRHFIDTRNFEKNASKIPSLNLWMKLPAVHDFFFLRSPSSYFSFS